MRQFSAKGYAAIPQRKCYTRDRKQQSGLILTLRLNSENILHTISYQLKKLEEIEELCAKGQNPSKKRLDERIIYFSKRSSGGELTSNII